MTFTYTPHRLAIQETAPDEKRISVDTVLTIMERMMHRERQQEVADDYHGGW